MHPLSVWANYCTSQSRPITVSYRPGPVGLRYSPREVCTSVARGTLTSSLLSFILVLRSLSSLVSLLPSRLKLSPPVLSTRLQSPLVGLSLGSSPFCLPLAQLPECQNSPSLLHNQSPLTPHLLLLVPVAILPIPADQLAH